MSCGGPAIPALFFEMAPLSGPPYARSGVYLFHRGLTFCQEGKLSHLNWILEALARNDRQQSQTWVLSEDVFEVCLQAAKGFRSFLDGQWPQTPSPLSAVGDTRQAQPMTSTTYCCLSLSLSLSFSFGPGFSPNQLPPRVENLTGRQGQTWPIVGRQLEQQAVAEDPSLGEFFCK